MKCRSKSTSAFNDCLRCNALAADLRFLLAVSRINGDLERIGDQAVNIAHSAMRVLRHPQVKPYVDLPRMSELAEGMVRGNEHPVVRGDIELAQSVLRRDDQVDRLRDQLFRELLTYMMENSAVVFAAFELVLVAKNLERIGDHATNIAEDVIYFVAGRDVRHPALDRRWFPLADISALTHSSSQPRSSCPSDYTASQETSMETTTVKWVGGEEFLANSGGHAVPFDANHKHNSSPTPMQMLLAALGACSSVDVVTILAKKRQKLISLAVAVSGERASEPPMVWTKIK